MTRHGSTRLPTFFIPHGGGPCFFTDFDDGPAGLLAPDEGLEVIS
jgi:hypothetical protein